MGTGILIALTALASFALGGYVFRLGYLDGSRNTWKIRGGEGDPTKIEQSPPITETDTS
jgi:hypothetical protein